MKNDYFDYENMIERDKRTAEELRHRIDLANLLANEVDDLIFSGKELTRPEWMTLKKTANRNKAFLVKLNTDPRLKTFLHLKENQEQSKSLTKRLCQSLTDAIDRLTVSINVIDDEIISNKNVIPGLSLQERALISAYKNEDIRKGQDIYNKWLYYVHRANRIGTESDKYGRFSHKKTSNKLKRIEKIIPHLPLSVQQTAIDELKTLKTNLTVALNNQSEI